MTTEIPSTSGESRPVSILDPLGPAFERMRRILFSPFDLNKWLAIGFCAWLAHLGEGGNFNFGNWGGGGDGGDFPSWPPNLSNETIMIIVAIAAVVILLLVGLTILLAWLQARGRLMFLDCVIEDRGAVKAPWAASRVPGNALFLFQLVIMIVFLSGIALIAGGGLFLAWPDIQARLFGPRAIAALAIAIPLMLLLAAAGLALTYTILDFIVPALRARPDRSPWDALAGCRDLVLERPGTFVLYWLFRLLLDGGLTACIFLFCCLTCCLALIPYIGTVMILPLLVFRRLYTLGFAAQFGPEWSGVPADAT